MRNDTKLLGVENMTEQQYIPAGSFASWLRSTRSALVKGNGAEVPCGDCNACCRSSYFIHIRPEETPTITRINRKLLFPAPGLPKGNVLLGYDKDGHCPMLIDNKCSIYEHRPLTCRSYDCRIFIAAGISAGDEDKALINQHIQHWKFSYPTNRDCDQHSAVQAAALFLREHAECFPGGVPSNLSQLAILAIKVYDVFLKYNDEPGKTGRIASDIVVAKAIMKANEKFEARCDMSVGVFL
jgi:Fe-S-cluster containining protein